MKYLNKNVYIFWQYNVQVPLPKHYFELNSLQSVKLCV